MCGGGPLLVAATPGVGHAATEANFAAKTTGDIVALCDPQSQSAIDSAGINFCNGFAQAAVMVEQEHEANPHAHKFFCLPESCTLAQRCDRRIRGMSARVA